MAFITKDQGSHCYSCGKQCINVEFCNEGSSNELLDYSISRNIKVSIEANPDFWGFGGVLISGVASYSNGYYDFFDGFDEDHQASKTCNEITSGPFRNEQRPDVFYRSVYDPDTGISKHYGSAGLLEGSGIGRGGAEVYLIDRPKGLVNTVSSDSSSCDDLDPTKVFKKFPENFGWGNKIHFNTSIYRNLTGAWRLSSIENCYENENIFNPPGYLLDCSGDYKQNIGLISDETKSLKASGDSLYYDYSDGCIPDGSVPKKYGGHFYPTQSIYRNLNQSEFIQAKLSYGKGDYLIGASGLKNGMVLGFKNDISGVFNNVYNIFDVEHQNEFTNVKLVGTSIENSIPINAIESGEFSFSIPLESGHWVAFETYDPQSCCGLAAYGVSDENKKLHISNYHSDFRKVFNSAKNIHQSNRDLQWRNNNGITQTVSTLNSGIRLDYSYVSVSGIEVTGVDGTVDISGFPLLEVNGEYVVNTGDSYVAGSPVFEKALSYYGDFYNTEKYDSQIRLNQKSNKGIARNATCYSKNATLEIFPECVTQYDKYEECLTEKEIFKINRVPRLAFVYRGCDFHDECSFDDYGRPLGAWKNQESIPQNINDLKRQLGGQEIHMFINLGDAWAGRKPGSPCDCNCDEYNGQQEPQHVVIKSPITYPSFPNFDINPEVYGCHDERYQSIKAFNLENNIGDCFQRCDTIPSSVYACMPRQPYATYGYIMNLCGKETNDRKNVIYEAFSNLNQSKTYTNVNSGENINEPMYWNIVAPPPSPVNNTGIWSSGTDSRYGGGTIIQYAGSGYGYWGLADSNNELIAPYFTTEKGQFRCQCDDVGVYKEYLDYSETGTWQNVLGTINGWPTNAVPFLISFELEDSCGGCVTTEMKDQDLYIEINGLDTEYIYNQNLRYGHNYCKYNDRLGSEQDVAQLDKPNFNCSTGFDLDYCEEGDGLKAIYANHYTGNTCNCVGSFGAVLQTIKVKDSDIIAGWSSNPNGGGAGLIEISGCENSGSFIFNGPQNTSERLYPLGYKVFAEFNLACPGNHEFLQPAECPSIFYGNIIDNLWANNKSCLHNYPATVGSFDGNLELQTDLYIVPEKSVHILRNMTDTALHQRNFESCISSGDFWANSTFGVCNGDIIYGYGCLLPEGYWGCVPISVCDGKTPCNTCPEYDPVESPDGINCRCDVDPVPIGWGGKIPRQIPTEWTLNGCYCSCSTPTLAHIYEVSGSNLVLKSGDPCREIYWLATESTEPILLTCNRVDPYLDDIGIKYLSIGSNDFYEWDHGVNGLESGIKYELKKPILAKEQDSTTNCEQLYADTNTPNKQIIDCGDSNCSYDGTINSKTCGEPIYSNQNDFDGVSVRRKKCSPEVAIVTKIECLENNGYRLYLSREYHEHDRTWREQITVEDENGNPQQICIPVNVGAYISGESCYKINYSLLADSVTPLSNPPCSINPSSGEYVNQDYQYLTTYNIWNYFNLFYSSGYLPSVPGGTLVPSIGRDEDGVYDCSLSPIPIQNSGTIFTQGEYESPSNFNGIFATNGKHSCVQDAIECGGGLWCNKMFFPRRKHLSGTKISAFGSPGICTANNNTETGYKYEGYKENGTYISGAESILSEQKLRFIDPCKSELTQTLTQDLGIDDNSIIIGDYLPLIGVIHPGWKYTSDIKSCTVINSGCNQHIDNHSDATIQAGQHYPKTFFQNGFESMGYYLDKYGTTYDNNSGSIVKATGDDKCLFLPFKILIDVTCSSNRIARKNSTIDEPTFLRGVQEWPAESCKGSFGEPGCDCEDTSCRFNVSKKGSCQSFLHFNARAPRVESSVPFCESPSCDESCNLICGEPTNGVWIDDINYEVMEGWLHPAITQESDAQGVLQYFFCPQPGCDTPYIIARPGVGNVVYNTCDDYYYFIDDTAYETLWECEGVQYIYETPSIFADEDLELCDCDNESKGICSATIKCIDFETCECNPIPEPNAYYDPSKVEACGCEALPLDDEPCQTNSIVKFEITENSV